MRKLAVGGETTQAAFAGPALRVIVSYKWQRIGKRALCSRACDRAFVSLLFPFLLLASCPRFYVERFLLVVIDHALVLSLNDVLRSSVINVLALSPSATPAHTHTHAHTTQINTCKQISLSLPFSPTAYYVIKSTLYFIYVALQTLSATKDRQNDNVSLVAALLILILVAFGLLEVLIDVVALCRDGFSIALKQFFSDPLSVLGTCVFECVYVCNCVCVCERERARERERERKRAR